MTKKKINTSKETQPKAASAAAKVLGGGQELVEEFNDLCQRHADLRNDLQNFYFKLGRFIDNAESAAGSTLVQVEK